jgi:hypothetical protein
LDSEIKIEKMINIERDFGRIEGEERKDGKDKGERERERERARKKKE